MIKGTEIFKIKNYDKFKCIADKCKYTCCSGWDIVVDSDILGKWKNDGDKNHLLDKVKMRKADGEVTYSMKKQSHSHCPFLNENMLCNIVTNHGEESIPDGCHTFPRIENVIDNRVEFSLSCACPVVVDMIGEEKQKIKLESGNEEEAELLSIILRDNIAKIIQVENIPVANKLVVAFQMLNHILYDDSIDEDNLFDFIENYTTIENVMALSMQIDKSISVTTESIEEVNNLFLDITENYKQVPVLKNLLSDITILAEDLELKELTDRWSTFKGEFENFELLLENSIVSKIFSNVISDNIDDMVISLQIIILEFVLTRHAAFLKYLIDKTTDLSNVKEYIMAFTRIIGNNEDAIVEFIFEDFEDCILPIEYLMSII